MQLPSTLNWKMLYHQEFNSQRIDLIGRLAMASLWIVSWGYFERFSVQFCFRLCKALERANLQVIGGSRKVSAAIKVLDSKYAGN